MTTIKRDFDTNVDREICISEAIAARVDVVGDSVVTAVITWVLALVARCSYRAAASWTIIYAKLNSCLYQLILPIEYRSRTRFRRFFQ